eukprot:CAMPEP_0117028730 /NCGR_PEP_ID=MMETSP0472-20121206/20870_1 /TAXON_ID=693140 ORGANISM="Tiarina fusus, Strain LIS" /NCGR_SAMPLE_ID=MMETSP0472 /ASSEMBLY_ACC=CAM_ASM_000603 /LENGTH=318 /DNA_ID=CAMNT_0004736311 /DNA_START=77 /DNA_END=1033 /DNA_ORIENTATION=-
MSIEPKQESIEGTPQPLSSLPISDNIVSQQPTSDPAPRTVVKRAGRRKINIEFIEDKSRRHITFSKRKAGIMKKAYELSTLTGTQVLLLVASETGHVYTFATPKLQPLITKPDGKNLIQACLNAPDTLQAVQNTNPHIGAQMSPGTPNYGHQEQQYNTMSQNDYGNQASPVQSPYAHHDDDKSGMPYGMHRPSFGDIKSYQSPSPSPSQDHNPMNQYNPYSSSSSGQMMSQGGGLPRVPYQNSNNGGPSLPTITDRGSFSNIQNHVPYNQFTPSGGMPSYAGPMSNSPFPSHNFPSNTSSQLFKASNLPPLPPHNNNL